MAKFGPSLVFSDESNAVSAETIAYISSQSEIHMLNILHRTMNIKQMVDLTAYISAGSKIHNLNIKLREPSGERGFALAVRNLAQAILVSGNISDCNIQIKALAFDLNCPTKTKLGENFKDVPDEAALLDFSQSEGPESLEERDELHDISDALGEFSNTVAALPGQAANGLFNLYQQMGNLSLGGMVPSIPVVPSFSSCMVPCMPSDEQQDQEQQRKEKKLK
tara:strand:+ start:59582 stop:60247 length:666 start_codon:yes stop_codon:yes gene_type:complete